MQTKLIEQADLKSAALVHSEAFPRQQSSRAWLSCSLNAFPRSLCFVLKEQGQVLGYIIWAQKSGFRPEVVLELEQIAVLPAYQGRGFGRQLIQESLPLVKKQLNSEGSKLKHIVVTTRADNQAQKLYQNVLNAKVEAIISNLYSADEAYMVARDVSL